MSIISLLPSATEIVCALGARERLVGRSHECDFPIGVQSLPVCTEAKVAVDGDSEDIHANVMSVLANDISVYRVHSDLVRDLRPSVIVTQVQCDVCAVSLRDVEAAIAGWMGNPARIVALNPARLEDVWTDIASVAEAIGERDAGVQLIESLKERISGIAARKHESRPRVATIEWISPLMAGGNWMPELVELAGGINLFGRAGEHSPWIEWSDVVAADPDVIVILPCGFSIERAQRDMHYLTDRPEWRDLRAVRSGNVHITDGNQYFNRPGPRLVESIEILAEILHPETFDFGHSGKSFSRLREKVAHRAG